MSKIWQRESWLDHETTFSLNIMKRGATKRVFLFTRKRVAKIKFCSLPLNELPRNRSCYETSWHEKSFLIRQETKNFEATKRVATTRVFEPSKKRVATKRIFWSHHDICRHETNCFNPQRNEVETCGQIGLKPEPNLTSAIDIACPNETLLRLRQTIVFFPNKKILPEDSSNCRL